MEILFLGTGGGRINLIKQIRWTGGFRINSSVANIHVDPGPGALIRTLQVKENPLSLDVLIVTHSHIDHCNDANLMIEAMSGYALKKKGILIGSKNLLEDPNERFITKYHVEHCAQIYYPAFENGDIEKAKFQTEKGSFEMEFIKVKHDEPTTFGFKITIENKTIGYTSDTNYFQELQQYFKGCDCLIINVLKPQHDGIPDHLETTHAIEIVKGAKPKMAIINHMGIAMIRAGPAAQAKLIEKNTGIPTIAPKDGETIKFDLLQFF
ncbi:MAG: MBL fold metallo-hydrolase [Candidatus Bilamarchaeaceae archaeon]